MNRSYPYRITLVMYNGMTERHHITARNYRDAFDKAHHFANPIAYSGKYGGCQFINVDKLTKQYVTDHNIKMEEV